MTDDEFKQEISKQKDRIIELQDEVIQLRKDNLGLARASALKDVKIAELRTKLELSRVE